MNVGPVRVLAGVVRHVAAEYDPVSLTQRCASCGALLAEATVHGKTAIEHEIERAIYPSYRPTPLWRLAPSRLFVAGDIVEASRYGLALDLRSRTPTCERTTP